MLLPESICSIITLESFTVLFSPKSWPTNYTDDKYHNFGESELKFILENLYGLSSLRPTQQIFFMITAPLPIRMRLRNGAI